MAVVLALGLTNTTPTLSNSGENRPSIQREEIFDAPSIPVLPEIAMLPEIADKPLKDVLSPRGFPKGWCTSYVASRRPITWSGNAGNWYEAAKAQGYEVGSEARIGAIYVTRAENSAGCPNCGHVAYVEEVTEEGVKLSEMNYVAFGKISYRTVTYEELAQKRVGFIY